MLTSRTGPTEHDRGQSVVEPALPAELIHELIRSAIGWKPRQALLSIVAC